MRCICVQYVDSESGNNYNSERFLLGEEVEIGALPSLQVDDGSIYYAMDSDVAGSSPQGMLHRDAYHLPLSVYVPVSVFAFLCVTVCVRICLYVSVSAGRDCMCVCVSLGGCLSVC